MSAISYISFAYRNPMVTPGKEVKVSVEVENTGSDVLA
jgi:hypothetical protein